MTNYELLTNMSLEELVSYLANQTGCHYCPCNDARGRCTARLGDPDHIDFKRCRQKWVEYLKQTAKKEKKEKEGIFKIGDKVRLNDEKLTALMREYGLTWYYTFKKKHKGTKVFTIRNVYQAGDFYTLEEDNVLFFREEWLEALEEKQ